MILWGEDYGLKVSINDQAPPQAMAAVRLWLVGCIYLFAHKFAFIVTNLCNPAVKIVLRNRLDSSGSDVFEQVFGFITVIKNSFTSLHEFLVTHRALHRVYLLAHEPNVVLLQARSEFLSGSGGNVIRVDFLRVERHSCDRTSTTLSNNQASYVVKGDCFLCCLLFHSLTFTPIRKEPEIRFTDFSQGDDTWVF